MRIAISGHRELPPTTERLADQAIRSSSPPTQAAKARPGCAPVTVTHPVGHSISST